MTKTKFTLEHENYIRKNFGILKIVQIAENLNLKERSVRYLCKKLNLKLSPEQKTIVLKQRNKKYSHNENFFSDLNNKSAYWAGFIAADGCIIDNRLKIKLKSTDEVHLSTFLDDINSTHTILHETGKRNDTITYSSTVLISSDKMIKDLLEIYNITPNKSLTLTPPNITTELYIDCFIKGLFDGDGTVYWKDDRFYCIRFYGTKEINEWIKKRIDILNEKNSGSIFEKNNIWCFELNTNASKLFIKHFKNIESPELSRKWDEKYLNSCLVPNKKGQRMIERYTNVINLKNKNMSATDISKILNVSKDTIYRYYKQPLFIQMEKELRETKQLDKMEIDIENEQ